MNKVFKLLALVPLLAALACCGSKKGPTGGLEDLEKPAVLASLPAEYGQIENNRIEITFSKPLDRASVAQAVYIYPPVARKKITAQKSSLLIRFDEELLPDTNYYVILSTRLKDTRGNPLAANQTLVFAHGKLNQLQLSGRIAYEDPGDNGRPVQLTLLSADSLQVRSHTAQGSSYSLAALNPASYLLRAFIDVNGNGRYDFSREPFCEGGVDLLRGANLDLMLAYADSTKPLIQTVTARSPREIEVLFSEPVAKLGEIKILADDDQSELPVLISRLRQNKLTLLTARQDKFLYALELRHIEDRKGNVMPVSRVEFRSLQEPDATPPQVTFTSPRNGTSVASLEPLLELHFSEVIPRSNLQARLLETETGLAIPVDILQSDNDIYRFKPRWTLQNYRSYALIVSAADISGNALKEEYRLNFLPLMRTE